MSGGLKRSDWWRQFNRVTAADRLRTANAKLDNVTTWARDTLSRTIPPSTSIETVETWLRKNASRLGWSEKPLSGSLEHLLALLELIEASIRQSSSRRTRMLLNTVFGKTAGALSVAGTTASVATFGVASTGTPIAALSGAASTSATLYWLGSTVGLGAAAGGVILGGIGIGVGAAVGIAGRKKLIGKPRDDTKLQQYEKDILDACDALIGALKKQNASQAPVSPAEMRFVAEQALLPLAMQINSHWDDTALNNTGKTECHPFTTTLAFLHRRNLNLCRTELGRIATAAIKAHPSR